MSVFLSATAGLWAMLIRYKALVAKSTMVGVFLDEVDMKSDGKLTRGCIRGHICLHEAGVRSWHQLFRYCRKVRKLGESVKKKEHNGS